MYGKEKEILGYMPSKLHEVLSRVFENCIDVQEIRLRSSRPLVISSGGGSFFVRPDGSLTKSECGYIFKLTAGDIERVFRAVCENSIYAHIEEIKQGFITIRGGHRVGFVGRALCDNGTISNLKEINSINIRIAHEVKGASDKVIDRIISRCGIESTLVISPPLIGKTTMLRDITRQISNIGVKVGVTDDRGEIAAMYKGEPQNDVGINTDVIENAPKSEAIVMLLRSMAPQVIVSDEIATERDSNAILLASGCGVSIIASAHGRSLESIRERRVIKPLFDAGVFTRAVVLSAVGNARNVEVINI